MTYDKVIHQKTAEERISYGIIFGNEKVVFVKCGAGGNIKGYKDKYIKLARRVHSRLGATVIVASNPDVEHGVQITSDKSMLTAVTAFLGLKNIEVNFVGTSDGGYYVLLLADQIPHSVKLLVINSSMKTTDDFLEKIQNLPHIEKTFVYGTEDELFNMSAQIKSREFEKTNVIAIEGADHSFTDKLDEFINLSSLI